MSDIQLSQNGDQEQPQANQRGVNVLDTHAGHPGQNNGQEEQQQVHLWRMRWFFIKCIFLWSALWMIIVVVVLCATKNPVSLSLLASLAAPLLVPRRLVRFLFPMDERDSRIKELEIQADVEKAKCGAAKGKPKAAGKLVKAPLQLLHPPDAGG